MRILELCGLGRGAHKLIGEFMETLFHIHPAMVMDLMSYIMNAIWDILSLFPESDGFLVDHSHAFINIAIELMNILVDPYKDLHLVLSNF